MMLDTRSGGMLDTFSGLPGIGVQHETEWFPASPLTIATLDNNVA